MVPSPKKPGTLGLQVCASMLCKTPRPSQLPFMAISDFSMSKVRFELYLFSGSSLPRDAQLLLAKHVGRFEMLSVMGCEVLSLELNLVSLGCSVQAHCNLTVHLPLAQQPSGCIFPLRVTISGS